MVPIRDTLPTRTKPVVNWTLIGLNVAMFGVELWGAAGDQRAEVLTSSLALVPARLLADPVGSLPSLFGHMFLHAGFSHIGGNMLFLWIFGDNVEDALGHFRYLLFYVLCGLAAAGLQVALMPSSTVPMLGASGAIAGVLAAYGLLYPRSPIQVLNPIPVLWFAWGLFFWLPAWIVIGEFFLVNLWSTVTGAGGGVAFAAHVGGFIAGLLLSPLLRKEPKVAYERWDRLVDPRQRRTSWRN
jgi:membrane associated rhomboid family serine protease